MIKNFAAHTPAFPRDLYSIQAPALVLWVRKAFQTLPIDLYTPFHSVVIAV